MSPWSALKDVHDCMPTAASVESSGGAVVWSLMVLTRSRQLDGLVCIPLTSAATSHLFAAAADRPLPSLASALVTGQGAEARACERLAGLASWGLVVLSHAWAVAQYAVSAQDPMASLQARSLEQSLVLTFYSVWQPVGRAPDRTGPRRCALVPCASANAPTAMAQHVNAAVASRITAPH